MSRLFLQIICKQTNKQRVWCYIEVGKAISDWLNIIISRLYCYIVISGTFEIVGENPAVGWEGDISPPMFDKGMVHCIIPHPNVLTLCEIKLTFTQFKTLEQNSKFH